MIAYFKKYSIFVCIIAVALPVVASTVWPLITGQMMAASIGGLILMFALFVLGLFIGYAVFEKKAEGIVDGYIAKYNEGCDPEALVEEGRWLAEAIHFPCNQIGSWFLGYYAQALLDLGRVDEAREIDKGLRESIHAARKPAMKAGILVNLLPLSEKLDDVHDALQLIVDGLEYCSEDGGRGVAQLREFLESQQKVLGARKSGDQKAIADMSEAIRASAAYPMRIRVEYAWDEAAAGFKLGDLAQEKSCLEFVAAHGNKLALTEKARARLSKLS